MEQIIKYSVVIPIYNSEKYLEQSIDSVINQKCDSSFEIILVNDGSTDHSGEICDRYVTLFPGEVQAIHQENKGLLMARREGLKHTRGVYVMHLDSDDYLREGALDVIDQALRNTNADILLFQASRHENFRIPFAELPFKNGEIIEGESMRRIYELLCGSTKLNNLCTKVSRRSVIDIDKNYNSLAHVKNGEDLLQSLPLFDAASRIVYIKDNLYYYRPNPVSITNIYNPSYFSSIQSVQEVRLAYAKKWTTGDGGIINLARAKARSACIEAMKSIIKSDISWEEKREKLDEITQDSLFLRVNEKPRKGQGIKKEAIAYLVKRRMFRVLRLLFALRRK